MAVLDTATAVKLPYAGGELSMILLLPDEENATLDTEDLARVPTATYYEQLVDLSLPKFEVRTELKLKDQLIELGMPLAFDRKAADFWNMLAPGSHFDEPPHVEEVYHQAWILVDEKGTEAAAASAVQGAVPTSMPEILPLIFDRPFYFFIVDDLSDSTLFLGRIDDPSAE